MCTMYTQKSEEGIGFPGIGVKDARERPCGCWESNTSPLQEQPMFLTSEPTLQSLSSLCFKTGFLIESRTLPFG